LTSSWVFTACVRGVALDRMPFSSAHCSTSWIVCFIGLRLDVFLA